MDRTVTTARGEVTIRPAREEDGAAFRELRLQALHDHPQVFSADYAASLAQPQSFWADRMRPSSGENGGIVYFAVHGEQLVGMTGLYQRKLPKVQHGAMIWGVYVRPEWRGLHLAEALTNECITWARTQGITIVKLAVITSNTEAILSYIRCGFTVYGVEPRALLYDSIYYDELLMARPL